MVLEPLRPEEEALHHKGIARIRRRLFRRYRPEDFCIIAGSERVLAASAENRWNAACGSYRSFRFGGLAYELDCGGRAGRCSFSVSHFDADVFMFWLGAARGHTVSALKVRFRELDEIVYAYIRSYRQTTAVCTRRRQ